MESLRKERFLENFPYFKRTSQTLVDNILSLSRCKTLPGNMLVKLEGDKCHDFVFMISGEKRIYKMGSSAREITLYEIGPGDICVLNAMCILSNTPLPANAATSSESEVLLLPAKHFLDMTGRYEEMRTFVNSRISESLVSIMTLISEITFRKMDERLKNYLIEKSENGILRRTHQQIANDLGSSREVISRLLKDFERQDLIVLSRYSVTLKNL